MVKSFKKKQKKNWYYLYYMIFKKILNCFFPSFNSKIEISKIETWVICEHKTHKRTHQQAQPNTQTQPMTHQK